MLKAAYSATDVLRGGVLSLSLSFSIFYPFSFFTRKEGLKPHTFSSLWRWR